MKSFTFVVKLANEAPEQFVEKLSAQNYRFSFQYKDDVVLIRTREDLSDCLKSGDHWFMMSETYS